MSGFLRPPGAVGVGGSGGVLLGGPVVDRDARGRRDRGRPRRARSGGPAVLGVEQAPSRQRLERWPMWWQRDALALPMHRSTNAHLASLYPSHASAGLGPRGVYLGVDESRSTFHFDPFSLYADRVITSPNLLVLGHIGSGKSSVVKTLLHRMIGVLGSPGGQPRFAMILDPKGEYGALARRLGLTQLSLRPGGATRLNPLDPGPVRGDIRDLAMRRTQIVTALAAAVLKRGLLQIEDAGLSWAVESLTSDWEARPTLVDVVRLLTSPTGSMVARSGVAPRVLIGELRDVRLALAKLLDRDLGGMFDGASTERIDWGGRGVVVDLSSVNNTDAQPLVVLATTGWFQQLLAAQESSSMPRRVQVLEEIWALIGNPTVARYYQASQKLARTYGVCNIAVAHRVEDFSAQADDGTATAKQGAGLIADTQTQVLFQMPPDQAVLAGEVFGLSAREQGLLTRLAPGQALWRIGAHRAVVTHARARSELAICDTDGAMRG